jgi:hypothetical protein
VAVSVAQIGAEVVSAALPETVEAEVQSCGASMTARAPRRSV